MDVLGGYASSGDEGDKQPAIAIVMPQLASSPAAAAEDSTTETPEEKAERKRKKQEKRERKAAKAAAAAAPTTSSLNAALPTPKLSLPSAAGLLAAATSRPSNFLALQESDRVREAMEAAAEAGVILARSTPTGVHQEAAQRAIREQQAQAATDKIRDEAITQHERDTLSAKRKAVADATARASSSSLTDRPSKKARSGADDDGTGGPARAGRTTLEKEKAKRALGQSGVETWKPEAWMQMRQNFDS